jgi:GT2 family glycosyltransferase
LKQPVMHCKVTVMSNPLIYLIILNWNGLSDTLECLESVFSLDYPNFKVIVVDNGSHDDSCPEIKAKFPTSVLIENHVNLGFAEGNNVGIRYAMQHGADYIFLLNNDTVVDPQILRELLGASQKYNDKGIFGAQIYYYSKPDKIWYAGVKWEPSSSSFNHLEDELCKDLIEETDYACGCALFLRANIVDKIRLLDSKFFLTFEETDWCYRAKRAGIGSYCVANAKVYHKISTSFGGSNSPLISYFLTRNSLLWGERHLSLIKYIKLIIIILRRILWMSAPKSKFKYRSINLIYVLKQHYSGKYQSVISHACYLGLRDYFLRKFGNCPSDVSLLLNTDLQINEHPNTTQS